jgi:hypothetical protein
MSDVDMSEEDANSPSNTTSNSQEKQYLIDTIAQLEQRLRKAQTHIDSYQIERGELLETILELKLRLQNVVDILEE